MLFPLAWPLMGGGLKGHPGRADSNSKQQFTGRASHWAGEPSSTRHSREGVSLAMTLLIPLHGISLLFSSSRE